MGKTLIDERYELRGLVGSGGMAYVYLAHDKVLDREVALKLLKTRYAENEELVERFRREARSAASLCHPHIVPVFDWGETEDGTYYIAMEYLPGGTLKDDILKRGTLPPWMVAEAALQIAKALRAAHVGGIVHRDVKPRNILVSDSGHVKVADFGIARAAEATTISDTGDILGSAKYMSPEQAAGERDIDGRSDIYSLGCVLFEMLAGGPPFTGRTAQAVIAKRFAGEVPPLRVVRRDVPPELERAVLRALALSPEARFQTGAQFADAVGGRVATVH
jgi:eukaryotic-like serine/threonine-protein kinase